jgi:muramoyltetrapeptide carboxypeptidase
MTTASTHHELKTIKSAAINPGDRVGLVCPAGRPESAAVIARCVKVVEELGFVPVVGEHVLKIQGFMAGSAQERAADLNGFIENDSIKAIFCLTGGYGSLHVLPLVNYEKLAASPKLITGCDDNTSLLNAIHARTGLVCFHAPNVDQIKTKFTFDRFRSLVTSNSQSSFSTREACNDVVGGGDHYFPVDGVCEGSLIGGNLTALVSLLGTQYAPSFERSLIFLEDKNEQNGILDRWFTTLYIAGHLRSASGVAFGYFENCNPKQSLNMLSIVDTFGDRLKELKKPSCFGFPFGQGSDTVGVPIGTLARLNCQAGTIELLESPLS